MSKHPPYLPFGDLLEELREAGFPLGADVHIRIRQLLNGYAEKPELTPVSTLRYQLGALIARSEAELALFYATFDNYLDKHSYEDREQGTGSREQGTGGRVQGTRLWYLLALLPLLALWLWWIFTPAHPELAWEFSVNPASSGAQTLQFGGRIRQGGAMWSLGGVPVPDSGRIDFGDGESP